ncbi:hypothetical protein CA13_31170 [Planctomycetes bacterium CA13]|uniref:Uncharacterized protein n=2 Tax=Novipirellula herctigrandis TaxID=2527986 RepID=A0A5C5Z321_9BACT|nr:hypothetical protein CA13_31170 [Planctomycetes bacterium CA13]
MENPTGTISFRLSTKLQLSCTDPNFWDIVHEHGIEVDRLSGYDHEMVDALVDWLASEFRISSLRTARVACAPGTQFLGLFDQHDLNVLRTRLAKYPNTSAASVFDAYGLSIAISPHDGDWMGFFSRQSDHLKSHDHKLLIVCTETDADYAV